jgi:hypothetical protein
MIFFLLITCATEILGHHFKLLYLADKKHMPPNLWLYNILLFFQYTFYCLVFNYLLKRYITVTPYIIATFIILTLIYIFGLVKNGVFKYNELTNTVMLVLIIVASLFYYYFLFNDDEYVNVLTNAEFWWVAGILFFYFGSTVCNIFFDSISSDEKQHLKHLNSVIYKVLNIIYYLCWSYSFICRRWLTRTSAV